MGSETGIPWSWIIGAVLIVLAIKFLLWIFRSGMDVWAGNEVLRQTGSKVQFQQNMKTYAALSIIKRLMRNVF